MTQAIQTGSVFSGLDNYDKALKFKLTIVQQKFEVISGHHIFKRGFTNRLGTLFKNMTGNLCKTAAESYDKAIQTLH